MSKIEKIKQKTNDCISIKSSYILNEIFSFLNMKQKLKIMIYNKQLQEKLGFNIENYKKLSGKYKIGGKNGLGSEYILGTNKLIFEGEYLNGVRNGKGKEFQNFNYQIQFEGYNINHYIIFEGEYLNGVRNGNGKEYKFNGSLLFEGEH